MPFEQATDRHSADLASEERSGVATAGKGSTIQRKAAPRPLQRKTVNVQRHTTGAVPPPSTAPAGEDPFSLHLIGDVQRKESGDASAEQIHDAASRGIETPTTSMPHFDAIQRSFGADHDVSGIQAHVGGGAAEACHDMNAAAYAAGNHVAFASAPDLHTAAHEAAHVVQQAQGVNLYGGVGAVGDAYEQHADAVADRVVRGESAADLLSAGAGGDVAGVQRKAVQRWGMDNAPIGDPDKDPKVKAAMGGGGGKGGGGEKVAKLHLFAYIEAKDMSIAELKQGNVGHTWISLEYPDTSKVPDDMHASHKDKLKAGGKYSDPMGFWPAINEHIYYSTNPFNSYVKGWMRHPDDAHQGEEQATQTWDITNDEAKAVIAYAESKRSAKYSVFFYNCTDFGVEAVGAAGKNAPAAKQYGFFLMPNGLYEGIKANQKAGKGNTTVKDFDGSNETSVAGTPTEKKGG